MDQAENVLTETQKEVLQFIVRYIQSAGYSPTVRDIMDEFNFASPNGAQGHLRALKKKGFVDWEEKKARTIKVLKS